ncbi:polymorphic toxin-type HINT domain-containing protein [Actinomadura violacea]|uniref:Type IV secretion protein Rhs n=1 Tax=Actinomadura violacea TaxID=2819934 RepID=A0ABS3RPV7_9ACTN|nr:polymorphic toxin-type HINT domain-containing protein [Actinomadura violacea]MBO2458110.1 type IV secretion protein Rhs [Actinomadura violacea]
MITGRKTLVLARPRAARAVAAVMTVAVAAGLLSPPPPVLAAPSSQRPPALEHEDPVKGHDLKVRPRKNSTVKPGPAAETAWPKAGTSEVSLPAGSKPGVRAGALPVRILPVAKTTARSPIQAAGKVRVSILDQAAARKTGLDGVAFTVARTDQPKAGQPQSGQVGVELDYSQFAQAFGGAYGSRLRLFQVPACALSTPDKPECRLAAPVKTVNDGTKQTLTAEVTAAPATSQAGAANPSAGPAAAAAQSVGTVLVAAAGSSGSQGDYKATSLEASATWQAGGNGGDFTWSYPMRVPPVPGGLTPEVAVSYSSGSVDGKTANANGQPSWVGEGFDLWPGYIERRYKSCEDDGAPKDEWGNSPGDQCWGYDNATVTWNGKGGELIKAGDGTWRMKNDDGTKFERLTSSDTANGDNDGEYWKVTTTNGTQYFFGLNRVPGWTSGKPETDSTWTSPVFGDDADEPCHKSAFADSWCQQAYRWNLDYVVDPAGNAIVYNYAKETNYYGRNLKAADETPYIRGGYLKTISYGLRKDGLFAKAPAQVSFDTSERCIPNADFNCDPAKIGDKPDAWWDVPWDLHCDSGQDCKDTHGTLSPTFWSRKRLTSVTTQVLKPDGTGYRPVDSWTLTHKWGEADIERDLLLTSIQHTGHAADGSFITLPEVTFANVQLPNRVDKTGDDILKYIRYRVGAIDDESGGQIDISYSDPDTDCSLSDLPTPETNTSRCQPVIWQPPGRTDPITDWFHKYVVTSVMKSDRTGGSPDMVTKYDYQGGAAWHFDTDDGLTKEKNKTWSQWRGYGHVSTFTGPYNNPATQTDTYYLRGMDGDRKNKDGGEKSVTVSDGEGGTHTDAEAFAGFTLKTVSYDKPGGAVYSKTVNTPWKAQTASRTRSWGTTTANATALDSTQTWTAKDGGGWTQTKTDNTYTASGPGVGRITTVDDLGDVATASDDKCTRTSYADNTGAWMLNYPSRVETVAVNCATTPDRSKQLVADTRTYYDNGGFGDGPTTGDVTKIDTVASHNGTTATYVTQSQTRYDTYGRPTQATDAAGHVATTTYTDTQGLTTQVTTTGPPAKPGDASTSLTTTQQIDPAWGLPVTELDVSNGNLRTDLTYDPLGRLLKVWLPDRPKATAVPTYEYSYRVTDGKIVAVTTQTLDAAGHQKLAQIELLDGLLRTRQTQTPGPGGRLVSDIFYDDRGQVATTYATYAATGAPEATLFGVDVPGKIETQSHTQYDGLGRKTVESVSTENGDQPDSELFRTTYAYGGANRTSVTPLSGGTPTAQITDARGQIIEKRQYKASTPTGDYDATKYTYTPAGEIASVTDPSGNTFTTTYDLRGRKTHTTDPDKGATSYTYNDLNQVTSTTDARGKKIFIDYDGQGRKTATHDGAADGPILASWTYDTGTRGKGKLASATRHTTDGNYVTSLPKYDTLGRPQGTLLTIPDSQGPLKGKYAFTTDYNADGTVKSQGMPAAGGLPSEGILYTYDAWQRPTGVTGNATYINTAQYTATGKLTVLEYGSDPAKQAWQRFGYEHGTQRLNNVRTNRAGSSGADHNATYHFTDAGTITSISDTTPDGVDNQCFTYDHLQRLTQAWTQGSSDSCASAPAASMIGGPAPYWQTFTYDAAGNRKTETLHGVGGKTDTTRTYTYADPGHGNRLNTVVQTGGEGDRTDTYQYDATGNTTTRAIGYSPTNPGQTLDWDTEGELTKVTENGTTTSYIHDADGKTLIRKDATGSTLYLPDGTELRALTGAATATGTRYYSFAGQTVAMRTSDGTVTYLTADAQGTAQVAINAATLQTTVRRFDPFGNVRGLDDDATWPNDKGFVGGTQEPIGLTTLGARQYDPQTGRFISVDPLMDQADPQQMNGYTYANNSPVTNADPDGNMCRRLPDGMECWNGDGGDRRPNNGGGYDVHRPGHPVRHSGDTNEPMAPRYPARFPREDLGTTKQKRTIYRQILQDMLRYAHDKPETARETLQAQLAFCSEFEDDSLCHVNKGLSLHDELDILGAAGVDQADAVNALYYLAEGNWKNALLSGIAIVPWLGTLATSKRIAKAAKAGAKIGCNSFVPGTPVLLADGTSKPIEDIKVGDKVLATDPETGKTTAEPVLATITGHGDKNLVQITIDTGAPQPSWTSKKQPKDSGSLIRTNTGQNRGVVVATDHHPFWVAGDINKWIDATDLKPGMWLRTSAGTYAQVTATKHWTAHHQRAHNLTIAKLHTYYVEARNTPVLVHNSGRCDHIALGLSEKVPGFSQQVGARHLMGSESWMTELQTAAYFEPNTRFSVSLDGAEGLDTAIERGELYADGNFRIRKGGREPSPFDWEMYTLRESGAMARTTFYKNGKVVPNPFS